MADKKKKQELYSELGQKGVKKYSNLKESNPEWYDDMRHDIYQNRLAVNNNVGESTFRNLATIRANQQKEEKEKNKNKTIYDSMREDILNGNVMSRAEREYLSAERRYMNSLPNDEYRRAYTSSKETGGMYVSPYFSKGIEGKEKLKYNNDDWNNLSEAQRKKYLEWAQDDINKGKKEESSNKYVNFARSIIAESQGETSLANSVGYGLKNLEKNLPLVQLVTHGAFQNFTGYSTFDADNETQMMFQMLPDDIRQLLLKGWQLSDNSPTKNELRQYYSDEMIDKLVAYGNKVGNIYKQQERNAVEEERMKNPFYATVVAPAKQIGYDLAVKPIAGVIDIVESNKALNQGIYGEYDPLRTEAQKMAQDARYINQSILEGLQYGVDIPFTENEKLEQFAGNAAQFSYNTSVSAAESAIRMYMANAGGAMFSRTMPFINAETASKALLTGMMSTAVFNDDLNENIQKGMPLEDAIGSAVAHSIFESLFEEISLDKLGYFQEAPVLKSKGAFVKQLLKAGVVEGSEEAFTDIANELYDHYVGNYDYSEYKAFKDNYLQKNPGANDAEVWLNFTKQFSWQVAQSFAGGALSSFALSSTQGMDALHRGETYIQNGQNVSDADYARMLDFVTEMAAVNPSIRNQLEESKAGGDIAVRGFVKMVTDKYSDSFNRSIQEADTKDKLNVVMNNVNAALNGAISEDTFNAYNAKLVELGEQPADYKTFVENRQKMGDTTFSELAYGRGNNAISRNIVEASKSIAETKENVNLSESERETTINKLRGKVEQNVKKAEDMVARYAQMGKTLDSPEIRQFESILGLENMAQIYSAGKIASENKMLPSVTGRSGKLFAVDKTSEGAKAIFGDNIGHIQDVPFSELQKTTAYSLGKVLAKMTGVNIAFYKSDRQKVQNGAFHRASNTIYIDVNAGTSGADAAVGEAFSHELTHWLRANNEEGYQRLLDFVRTDLGDSYKSMLKDHMERLGLDEDVAGEEIVAEACQRMLKDSETFKRYAATDMEGAKTLLQRLVDFVRNLRDAFKGSLNNEATRMISDLEGLQQTWETALQEAISEQTAIEGGIDVETFEDTAVRDSIRTVLDEKQQERVSNMLQEKLGVDKKTADEYIKNEQSIASLIFDNIGFLDYKPDDRYEAIKKNSDYPQGTVDMTNLCRKRAIFTQIFDSLQEHFPNRLFNAMDIADIREVLKTNGYQVACALCFVEDRRQRVGEIAESFIERLKASNGKTLTVVNSKGETKELFMTKDLANTDVARAAGFKYKDAIKVTDKYIPNQYDLVTYEGFKELSKNHPQVAAAFTRANNYLGMSSARLVEGRAEYKRDILKYTPAQVKRINNKGGLRIFSFSDFEAVHLLDICQVIMDASAVGLKIQAYTKVPAFAKLVANTGIKLNRSLIAAGKGFKVNPDGSRSLIYDTHEGIDINDPDFFDSSDNPNIGNILVGISDEHIRLAMEDDFVDYIIPFHSNQGRNVLAVKGISHWTNYKEFQRERYADGRKGARDVNIYTQVIDKYRPTNNVEFVEAFLKECKAQGKIPRFDQFLNKVNGEYVYTPGYEKLLLDFKLFDKNGYILPQTNVNPNIDMTAAKRILNDEVKGAAKREQVSGKIIDELENKYETRYATRDISIDAANNETLRYKIQTSNDSVFQTYRAFYDQYQQGVANEKTAHHHTIAVFSDIHSRPLREPDHRSQSFDKKANRFITTSEYWYYADGMVRCSTHWGKVGSSDWYFEGQRGGSTPKQYGFVKWKDFTHKFSVEATNKPGSILADGTHYVSTFDSYAADLTKKENSKTSLLSQESNKGIRVGMSDGERADILRDARVQVKIYSGQSDTFIQSDLDPISAKAKFVKKAIERMEKVFPAFTDYYNVDYDVVLSFAKAALERSESEISDPTRIAKLLPIVETAIENAVVFEAHENRDFSEETVSVYLEMIGGYVDNGRFIPILFEVKRTIDGQNNINVIIDSEGIKRSKVMGSPNNFVDNPRLLSLSVAKILGNVKNERILLYTPSEFLPKRKEIKKSRKASDVDMGLIAKNDAEFDNAVNVARNNRKAYNMILRAAEGNGFYEDGAIARHRIVPSIVRSLDIELYDDNGDFVPLSERFKLTPEEQAQVDRANKGDVMFSSRGSERSIEEINADYMKAYESGDERLMSRYVDEAARRAGYNSPKVFHGTRFFGWTRYKDDSHDTPFIYTSTDSSVSANYAGDNHYAGIRKIGKAFKYSNDINDIIQNAESVYDTKYHIATNKERQTVYDEVVKEASEIADKLNTFDATFDFDDELANAMARIESAFWTVQSFNDEWGNKWNDNRQTKLDLLKSDLRSHEEDREKLRNWYGEHRNELSAEQKKVMSYLLSYEVGDALIDMEYSLEKALYDGQIIASDVRGMYSDVSVNFAIPSEIQDAMEQIYNIGSYQLYGDLGDNPLEFDANGSQFWALKVPQMGDDEYHGTDAVSKWAAENGYTSVIMHNIYDYGNKADNYVFFSSNQLKSADPVTYDDNGNVIPLSERFNKKNDDIRFSYRDLANSESEILINALKNDAALVDSFGARKSIEAYAREYGKLKEMEKQSLEYSKQLTKKGTTPSEREAILRKQVRLDRAILNKTTELTEMRNQRVIRDLLIDEWDKRDTMIKAGKAEERYLTKKALEEKYGKELASLKAKSKEQQKAIRDRNEINKRKKNIEKKTKELMNRILHGTEKKHIPSILVNPIVELLDSIDYWTPAEGRPITKKSESLRTRFVNFREAINQYQKAIDEGANMTEYMFDGDFLDEVEELCSSVKDIKNVNDMTVEEITDLDHVLTTLNHLISRGNKMIVQSHYETIDDAKQTTGAELIPRKNVKKTAGSYRQRLNAGMADTYAFGEYAGDGARQIVEMLSEANEKRIRQIRQVTEFAEKTLEGTGFEKWKKEEASFTTDGGAKITLTVPQMMELYLLNNREQARKHIYGEGISIENKKGKFTEPVKMTENDVNQVIKYLKDNFPKAVEVADKLQKFGATVLTGWGNEASNLLWGISKFTEPDYWQIRSDTSGMKEDQRLEQATPENASMYRLQNLGRTKQTNPNAYNAIYIGDVFDTFLSTVDDMTAYSSILPATTDALRWFNSMIELDDGRKIRVKKLLQNKLGTDMVKVFTESIKAMNGGIAKGNNSLEGLLGKLMGNAKAAAVAGNLRVVFQQPTAYTRAYSVMEAKYLDKALLMKPAVKEMQEHSAIGWWKSQGFFSNGLAPSLRKLVLNDGSVMEKATEKLLIPAGFADDITWGTLWNAAKLKVEDTQPNLVKGSQEYFDAIEKVHSHVINQTQVVDTPLTKALWMRGGSGGKSLTALYTAFMNEPMKTYSMVSTALDKALRGEKGGKKMLGIAIASFGLNAVVNAMAQAIADAARDDDIEKNYWEKYLEKFKGNALDNANPLTYIPVIKEAWSMSQGFQNNRLDLQAIQNTINAGNEIMRIMQHKSKKTLFGQAEVIAKAVSSWTGVPLTNVMRTFNSLGNIAGIDIFRRKEYKNTELARNIVVSIEDGDMEDAAKYSEQLLKAVNGDEKKYTNYIADYLAENSLVIEDYAERYIDDPSVMNDALDELGQYFSDDIIMKSVRKYAKNSGEDVGTKTLANETSIYTSNDLNRMLEKGDISKAQQIIDSINKSYAEVGSKTTAKNAVTDYWKPKYLAASGEERSRILQMLYKLKNNGKQMYSAKDIQKWK